jgi:hypothetical protein
MGVVFGLFAAFYFWIDLFTGLKYSDVLGRIHFWLTFVGVNLTFFPMHFLGIAGMPRRIPDYPDIYFAWNFVSSVGSLVSVFGVVLFLWIMVEVFIKNNLFFRISAARKVIILNDKIYGMSKDFRKLHARHRSRNVYLFLKYNFFNKLDRIISSLYVSRDSVIVAKFKKDMDGFKVGDDFLQTNILINDYIFSKDVFITYSSRYNLRFGLVKDLYKAVLCLVPSSFVFLHCFYGFKVCDNVW